MAKSVYFMFVFNPGFIPDKSEGQGLADEVFGRIALGKVYMEAAGAACRGTLANRQGQVGTVRGFHIEFGLFCIGRHTGINDDTGFLAFQMNSNLVDGEAIDQLSC